jgi:hypothetical protein
MNMLKLSFNVAADDMNPRLHYRIRNMELLHYFYTLSGERPDLMLIHATPIHRTQQQYPNYWYQLS